MSFKNTNWLGNAIFFINLKDLYKKLRYVKFKIYTLENNNKKKMWVVFPSVNLIKYWIRSIHPKSNVRKKQTLSRNWNVLCL